MIISGKVLSSKDYQRKDGTTGSKYFVDIAGEVAPVYTSNVFKVGEDMPFEVVTKTSKEPPYNVYFTLRPTKKG